MTKFYTFTQNNTGGYHKIDKQSAIGHYVIVEAKNSDEANNIAIQIGLYFDGICEGLDCSCCGDRWYRVFSEDGTLKPMIYDKPAAEYKPLFEDALCYVHYLNGEIKEYTLNKK